MNDYLKQKLEEFIEGYDLDATVEEIKPIYEEKRENVERMGMEEFEEEQAIDYAVAQMKGDDVQERRTGGDGEKMELSVLSIGQRGVWNDHPATDEDTVTGHGIIHGPIGDDGEERAAKAIFLLKASDVDKLDVQSKFHCLNTLKGTFEVEEAWDLNNVYRVHSTDETEIEEVELEELPDDRDGKNDMLRKMFPDVELAALAEDGEGLSAFDPDSGFTLDWGADIKRFRGTVVDHYIADDRSFGIYTLMDDSVTPDDIEDVDAIVGENQNTPGLTVFASPDYHMQYGDNSIVDVYGVTETNDDGQIVMRAAGIVPIVPMEMEDENEAEGVESTETSI